MTRMGATFEALMAFSLTGNHYDIESERQRVAQRPLCTLLLSLARINWVKASDSFKVPTVTRAAQTSCVHYLTWGKATIQLHAAFIHKARSIGSKCNQAQIFVSISQSRTLWSNEWNIICITNHEEWKCRLHCWYMELRFKKPQLLARPQEFCCCQRGVRIGEEQLDESGAHVNVVKEISMLWSMRVIAHLTCSLRTSPLANWNETFYACVCKDTHSTLYRRSSPRQPRFHQASALITRKEAISSVRGLKAKKDTQEEPLRCLVQILAQQEALLTFRARCACFVYILTPTCATSFRLTALWN